ncbi:hypothetical protein Q1695_003990 [Nippostrongylus brasiliensis]|nr:hypothetical protein Q1695_003990 [Nippostrongylus brasiliensis]
MSDGVGGVRVVSGGGAAAKKKTSSSCPFGEGFYAKITKLLLSKDPSAVKELKECARIVSAAKLDPADEFWDSGDEIAGVDSPSSSTTATTTSSSDIRAVPKKASAERNRLIHLDTVPGAEKRPPTKAKVDPPPVPEKKRKGPIVLPGARRSDDSDSDDAKMAEKPCKKCGEKATTTANSILTCEACSTSYHQKCHKPEVTTQQSTDPRFIFLCCDCSSKGVASTKSRSSSPKLVIKPDTAAQNRASGLPQRSGSDISATFEAYKKKKERQVMKTKAAMSSSSSAK